ncbi:MAG: Hsp20/alpha crystallin family protein [Candidatus Kerfeldbacteria bacterium]|nr:Hsp20/alpha crystallin family protein [Candidatus Kerfeldbacteria bacterium]
MSILSFFVKNRKAVEPAAGELARSVAVSPPASGDAGVEWYSGEYEGQLAVDVYQTDNQVVIVSTIAGVRTEDLDITLNNDVITIRGRRYQDRAVAPEDYIYQECYWGGFSRSIVLPVEVDPEKVEASLKNGILTVKLYKIKTKSVAVKIESNDD